MNNTWSFVDAAGTPSGARFTGPERALAANTPEGCSAVEGVLPIPPRNDPELIRSRIVERIEALERKQARPLRELAMDPGNEKAASKLAAIEAEIASARDALRE